MASGRAGYARTSDGLYVAYRVWGEKDPVHIYLSDFGATVDTRDLHPVFIRLWRTLANVSLVASLDRRGVGTSEVACPQRFELSDYVLDVLAVADALNAERFVLTGEGVFGASAAVAFAVAHPERVARLAFVNGTVSFVRRDDYDLALFSRDEALAMIDHYFPLWGQGDFIAAFAPGLASDPLFIEVCGRLERFFCGPTTARMCAHAVLDYDLRDLATQVTVPTLVYFTGDLAYVTAEQSRDLADRIPHASLIEAPGRLFYVPDQLPQLDEFAAFIGGRIDPDPTIAACLMFIDVVGSTDHARTMGDAHWLRVLDDLDAFVEHEVTARGGRVVKHTGDGHLALFDVSADAVDAAMMISRGVTALGIDVRTGVHCGDVRLRPNGDIGGIAVHYATRVMSAAGPRQVYASQSVFEDLSSSSLGFKFSDRGECSLRGIQGSHKLFEVEHG